MGKDKRLNLNSPTLPYHRIVAKFGTSLLIDDRGHLNQGILSSLIAQVARLHEQGLELIVVSSGSIASGRVIKRFSCLGQQC